MRTYKKGNFIPAKLDNESNLYRYTDWFVIELTSGNGRKRKVASPTVKTLSLIRNSTFVIFCLFTEPLYHYIDLDELISSITYENNSQNTS